MGYDFLVEYRPGRLNTVADALSRSDSDTAGSLCALSSLWLALFDEIRAASKVDPAVIALRDEVLAGLRGTPWAISDGLLLFDKRIYIPATPILPSILSAIHEEGHERVQKTLHRLKADFHVPRARHLVQKFIRDCQVCQRNKTEHLHLASLLQPFEAPSVIWEDISMDFVEGFRIISRS